MQDTFYHMLLRTSALTLAIILLFESGVVSPITKQLSHNAGDYVATAIGVNAAVVPTEINSITAELTQKRQELAAREAAIAEREIAVNLNDESGNDDMTTYILSVILFILLTLIILNYILDFMRSRRLTNAGHEKMA